MTTIAAFASIEESGNPSAVYLMSDSRISWSTRGHSIAKFDFGQKLFYFKNSPDALAYCGDSFFGVNVLSKITNILDLSGSFIELRNIEQKAALIITLLN